MSEGYTKLFSDIVDSSIWEEAPETRIVWVTLLALCNRDGFVRGSPGWLAGKSRVSLESCEKALEIFKRPDPRSRTPDNDGRRIEQLEDGWLILNYLIFRDRLSTDTKAIKTRERVRKHRERHAQRYVTPEALHGVTSGVSVSASVTVPVGKGMQGEREFKLNGEKPEGPADEYGNPIPLNFDTAEFKAVLGEWHAYKRERHEPYKPLGARQCLGKLVAMGSPEVAIRAMKDAMGSNYQGFFKPRNERSSDQEAPRNAI